MPRSVVLIYVISINDSIVKKGDELARLPRACFSLMALKFKPVVVTAVSICDPLSSV